MLAAGVAIGIYLLPILRAPPPLATADIQATTSAATFKGRFARNQKGGEFLHRGEGEIETARDRIAHMGEQAASPDHASDLSKTRLAVAQGAEIA